MKIFKTINETKNFLREQRKSGKSVGLVPTMGFLHEGHLSLVRKSVNENDITVVSIFVNPAQFGPNEDFDSYPRNFDRDTALLKKNAVDCVFAPEVSEMYPNNFSTKVTVNKITDYLCGAKRPGHFDGVAIVVTKLLNIVGPDKAYFGMKDYQQLKVIQRLVKDLNMDVEIKGGPIVRENDGLAMSSRNTYLTQAQRKSALSLVKSFDIVQRMLDQGERSAKSLKEAVHNYISGFEHTSIDYVEIVDKETLEPLETVSQSFLVALAVYVGKARLIDNKLFEVKRC